MVPHAIGNMEKMSQFQLHSNDDLQQYLLRLSNEFRQRGYADTANEIMAVSQFALGSPSEFLDEADKLLRSVHASSHDVLTKTERSDLVEAIKHIDTAFRRIGGA
jgi:hypothetical protein